MAQYTVEIPGDFPGFVEADTDAAALLSARHFRPTAQGRVLITPSGERISVPDGLPTGNEPVADIDAEPEPEGGESTDESAVDTP